MQFDNLGTVERKVLGALIILADEKKTINATMQDLADVMGYKSVGGAMTFAIKILERDNFVVRTSKSMYKLLI